MRKVNSTNSAVFFVELAEFKVHRFQRGLAVFERDPLTGKRQLGVACLSKKMAFSIEPYKHHLTKLFDELDVADQVLIGYGGSVANSPE